MARTLDCTALAALIFFSTALLYGSAASATELRMALFTSIRSQAAEWFAKKLTEQGRCWLIQKKGSVPSLEYAIF